MSFKRYLKQLRRRGDKLAANKARVLGRNRNRLRKEFQNLASQLPLNRRRIVFSSFVGKGCSDSPLYLYRYLYKNLKGFEFIWALNDPDIPIEGPAKKVEFGSSKHLFYLNTSKFWISNARIPNGVNKRKEVIHLQTWHGTPLKKLGFDIELPVFGGPGYHKNLRSQTEGWDYLVSQNPYSTEVFQSAFEFSRDKIWETGYPRSDILFQKSSASRIDDLRKRLGIPKGKKVILYAPTWRDGNKLKEGEFAFDLELDLKRLESKFGQDAVVLMRMHYHSSNELASLDLGSFSIDVSDYPDVQELYLLSDLLITDYSSIMFDYSLLRRPIILYTYDWDTYDAVRGFYFDLVAMPPGPIVRDQEALEGEIERALLSPNDPYWQKSQFYERFCSTETGQATITIAERLFGTELHG